MIYLDYAATTRPYPETLDAYVSVADHTFANAGSHHYFGVTASHLLEDARTSILKDLRLDASHKAMFVSGATEGNNTVFQGIGLKYANRGKKMLVGATEHPSVLETAKAMGRLFGFEIVVLPVDSNGLVAPSTLREYMDKETLLVSIMSVNNETGAVNDLKALASVVHEFPKAFFHSDVTQGIGKVAMDYSCCDLLTFSGHKIGGVKGTGALIYRKNISFESLHHGGAQESGFRSGTVDVPGAASLAKALHLTLASIKPWGEHVSSLRKALIEGLVNDPLISLNVPEGASPYVVNFSLAKHKASVVVEALSNRGIYVSSIAACSSKGEASSYVLEAMGKPSWAYENSIRVSFSHDSTLEDVQAFLDALHQILSEVVPR